MKNIKLLNERKKTGVKIIKEKKTAYKIFLKENRQIKNLFKAVEGSRNIETNKWIKATQKWSFDGSNYNWYWTGIHCLPTLEDAKKYLGNFKTEKNRVIGKIEIENYHFKPSNNKVLLAHKMKLLKIIN